MLVGKIQMLVGLFSTHCYFRVFPANTLVAVMYMNNKSVFMPLLLNLFQTEYCHMLNATMCAVTRVICVLLELNQVQMSRNFFSRH
jgi:hypothetical protein